MIEISTEHGIFTDNEETGQTAEEVYQEWLDNKNKPSLPSLENRLETTEEMLLFLMNINLMGGM